MGRENFVVQDLADSRMPDLVFFSRLYAALDAEVKSLRHRVGALESGRESIACERDALLARIIRTKNQGRRFRFACDTLSNRLDDDVGRTGALFQVFESTFEELLKLFACHMDTSVRDYGRNIWPPRGSL